jgi:hypothetical protein
MEQLGIYEIEHPSTLHECGPQWSNLIDDDLSKAKGYFLLGYSIIWIYRGYRAKLQDMIDHKTWRSGDVSLFVQVLDRAYAQALTIATPQVVIRDTPPEREYTQV